jgi:hypothetical protein
MRTLKFTTIEAWLNGAVAHFGGTTRTTNGAYLSGDASPGIFDIVLHEMGSFFEVHIKEDSPSVVGGPLMWGFPTEEEAGEFEYFLKNIADNAPEAFLTRCGSGPLCSEVGASVCYLDPTTGGLQMSEHDNPTSPAVFSDSFEWFNKCASSLGCSKLPEGGLFLHYGSPNHTLKGTRFVFENNGVEGPPIEWECGNVENAHDLLEFANTAARDPFYPFAIGGPFESKHSFQQT